MTPIRTALAALLILPFAATPAQGQYLTEVISDLFTFGECGEPLCLDVGAFHGNHFIPSLVQGEDNLLAFLEGSVGQSLGNLPFAAASGGITFTFEDGVPVATSISPGPVFSERAQTLGQGRAVLGVNLSGVSFSSVRGVPIEDLTFRFAHENVGGPMGDPIWESDFVEVALDLEVSLLVTALFASYGLTDDVDLSLQVPLVHSRVAGHSRAVMHQVDPESPHFFITPGGAQTTEAEATASGSAIGVGDIAARMKVGLAESDNSQFSVVGDVRLPTGRPDDFHGAGSASFRLAGIASGQIGDFSPHANVGFITRGGWNHVNSVAMVGGFDRMLSDWATLSVELVGDFQVEDTPLRLPDPVLFEEGPRSGTSMELSNIPERSDHLLDIGVGFKFDAPADTRVVTSALIPFLEGGTRPSMMWTVGLERSF